jgi:hypothetical protein
LEVSDPVGGGGVRLVGLGRGGGDGRTVRKEGGKGEEGEEKGYIRMSGRRNKGQNR